MALPGHCLFSGLIRSQSVLPMVFKRLCFFSGTLFSTSCVGKLLAVSPGRHFLPRCLSACKGLGWTFHGEGWHGHGNGIPHSLSPKPLLRRELQLPEPWSAGGLNQMTAKKSLCRWWQDRRSHSCEMKYIHHTVQKYANLQLFVLDKIKKCALSHSGERESKISITVSILILLLFVAHYSLQNTKRPQLGLNEVSLPRAEIPWSAAEQGQGAEDKSSRWRPRPQSPPSSASHHDSFTKTNTPDPTCHLERTFKLAENICNHWPVLNVSIIKKNQQQIYSQTSKKRKSGDQLCFGEAQVHHHVETAVPYVLYHIAQGVTAAHHLSSTGIKPLSLHSWCCGGKEELPFRSIQKQLQRIIIVT